MDNQTALAVQSLLDSQTVTEASQGVTSIDEEDIFQCGKCKKQFTSLASFLNHKQSQCTPVQVTPATIRPNAQISTNQNSAFITAVSQQSACTSINRQPLPQYSAVPASPLPQLSQSMVLSDELMTFASIDPNFQTQTLQLGGNVQNGTFMSQLTAVTPRSQNNVTIFSPVITTSAYTTNGSAFTNTMASNQITMQSAPQQITIATINDKPVNVNITKCSPTKGGKKSQAGQNSMITVIPDVTSSVVKQRRSKNMMHMSVDDVCNGKKKLKCQYCEKMFMKNFDLQQHVRSHTGEKPYQCIVCGRAFAQKSNVKKHMATHKVWPTGNGVTLPEQPPAELLSTEDNSTLNDDSGNGQLEEVSSASGMQEFVSHVVDSEGEDNDPDGSRTVHQVSIETGPGEHAQVNVIVDNSYVCQYCPLKFKTYFLLKSHMVHHKTEQVYKCVMKNCGSVFRDLDTFLDHTKSHENEMSYRCHMCNKNFETLYDLGIHQYSHSLYPNQAPKPGPKHFQCTKCMNKYSTPEALDHHISTCSHHFPCPHCPTIFPCERYLRRHLPTHGTMGQFQCPICQKRFKTEHYLKTHGLIHSGEKPYECHLCRASFNRKDKLKRHMLIHETIKKFRCPFKNLTGCTREFNRADKLKSHIITHSGIKPYKCNECNKTFSRKPHLIQHLRSHKSDYIFNCEKCGKGFFRPKLHQDHISKCQGLKPGSDPPSSRSRNRRKIGRPKKRMISITPDVVRQPVSDRFDFRRRSRTRRYGVEEDDDDDIPVPTTETEAQTECSASKSTALLAEQLPSADLAPPNVMHAFVRNTNSNQLAMTNVELAQGANSLDKDYTETEMMCHNPMTENDDISEKTAQDIVNHYVVHLPQEGTDSSEPLTLIPTSVTLNNSDSITTHLIPTSATHMINTSGHTMHPFTIIETRPLHIESRGGQMMMTSAGQNDPPLFVVDYAQPDSVQQQPESILKGL